jgi:hypothetical protein
LASSAYCGCLPIAYDTGVALMTISPIETLSLSALGKVPADYEHEWRLATPREPIVVPGGVFKWYHVHRDDVPVPDELDDAARRLIERDAAGWDLSYGLNFALIHQSVSWAYLIVGIWRGHQEWWERIYAVELKTPYAFTATEPDGAFMPGACVWELAVICHERMAWHRYLFSDREDEDKRAWLADTYDGVA